MKPIARLIFLIAFVASAFAEDKVPVVRTIAPELQSKFQFLNPQYLTYRPAGNTLSRLTHQKTA